MQWNLLTSTLAANALFSGASGLVLALGAGPMSEWLGIPTWLTVAVGAGLVLFSAQVAMTARSPHAAAVRLVIAGDSAWVLIATVLITVFPDSMSYSGLVALGAVTVVVGAFAVLQSIGLNRVSRTGASEAVAA